MKKLYLFGNWKMYLGHEESVALARDLKKQLSALSVKATMAIFPSAISLLAVKEELDGVASVGPQNVYWVEKGGYTGEISAMMYRQAGCQFALVGHSERRHVFKESNAEVRQKFEAVLNAEMTPVLCVGETMPERKDDRVEEVIEAQLRSAFMDLAWPKGRSLIIAYEPVWAGGTGESSDPSEAERVAAVIYKFVGALLDGVEPTVLYGGSVRSDNVAKYCAEPHLSGVLVGGASTKASTWLEIVSAVK